MEVVQGKKTDQKIVVAQEIAFAKVLAGNNKTLRDQALKKLRKWLKVRGHGNWAFTEEEFIRIWTGLFYCMWMSDKFLVQEELAENISQLIHCFRKNPKSALLFIKSFNKRILMEYEGLDQYRIDKFNMLIRRFLRQSFEYCKRIAWDESFLKPLTDIICDVIFHKDNTLGFILHFMNIYPEELAKVSQGKLENRTVLLLIEPFIKVFAKTREERIQNAVIEFFTYLMTQTDVGIEFEEKFKAWKQMGFPGKSMNSIKRIPLGNDSNSEESEVDEDGNNSEDEEDFDRPLDPRAGSIHVDLPQIPLDIGSLINLLNKYKNCKLTTNKSKRKIRSLIQKFSVLKKGKFPARIKKDEIIDEKTKAPRLTIKTAKRLLQYTEEIESSDIKTKEFAKIKKQLDRQNEVKNDRNGDKDSNGGTLTERIEHNDQIVEDSNEDANNDYDDDDGNELDEIEPESFLKSTKLLKKKLKTKKKGGNKNKSEKKERALIITNKSNKPNLPKDQKVVNVENGDKKLAMTAETKKKKKKRKKKNKLSNGLNEGPSSEDENLKSSKQQNVTKGRKLNGNVQNELVVSAHSPNGVSPKRNEIKRKILSNWQVQELDENSPEYNSLRPQKVIKLEVKRERMSGLEENQEPETETSTVENVQCLSQAKKEVEAVTPVFWDRAKSKVFKTKKSKQQQKIFRNPMAMGFNDSDSASFRRISFALDKNMAQENDEYLEEVRNSPKVPFDSSKKPVQSALKSGLSPSPINPFYRLKKIKF